MPEPLVRESNEAQQSTTPYNTVQHRPKSLTIPNPTRQQFVRHSNSAHVDLRIRSSREILSTGLPAVHVLPYEPQSLATQFAWHNQQCASRVSCLTASLYPHCSVGATRWLGACLGSATNYNGFAWHVPATRHQLQYLRLARVWHPPPTTVAPSVRLKTYCTPPLL